MIGEFETAIEFHRPVRTKTKGQTLEVFSFYAKDMAKVEYSIDREQGTDREVENSKLTINLHYRSDINTKDRIKIGDKFFRIGNISPDKRWMIQISASEIQQ